MWAHPWQLPADAFCFVVGAEINNLVAFGLELGALQYEEQEDGIVKLAALPMLQVLSAALNPMLSTPVGHVLALRLFVCNITRTVLFLCLIPYKGGVNEQAMDKVHFMQRSNHWKAVRFSKPFGLSKAFGLSEEVLHRVHALKLQTDSCITSVVAVQISNH